MRSCSSSLTLCEKCSRSKRCPEHSLAAYLPDILRYWDFDKNLYLNPYRLPPKTSVKAWFTCPSEKNCGHHRWECRIESFVNGTGCPYCKNRAVCPCTSAWDNILQIQQFWDFDKNVVYPAKIFKKSTIKCWFKCSQNHSWRSRLDTFARTPKCPHC